MLSGHQAVHSCENVMTAKPRPADDQAIADICAWLKRNDLIAQVTLSGKVTLTPKEELYTNLLFNAREEKI